MMRPQPALLAMVILGGLVAAQAAAADWPQWRGPDGTGRSTETAWSHADLSTRVAWRAAVGDGHSSPVVANGRVFLVGNDGHEDVIRCLDAATGKERWRRGFASDPGSYEGPRATPTVVNGRLIMVSRWGEVVSLAATTGTVQWTTDLTAAGAELPKWGHSSSALVHGDRVLINAATAGMALDLATGKVLWSSPAGISGYASPVLLGDGRAAMFGAQKLFLVDVSRGRRLASIPWETRYDVNAADPLVVPGGLFVSSGYGKGGGLITVDGDKLKQRWFSEDLAAQFSTPVLIDGHLYGVNGNTGRGALACLRLEDGATVWSEGGGFESLTAAGSRLIALDKAGDLVVVEATPKAYKELARATIFDTRGAKYWTPPVLANGRLYCRDSQGSVVCLDVSGG